MRATLRNKIISWLLFVLPILGCTTGGNKSTENTSNSSDDISSEATDEPIGSDTTVPDPSTDNPYDDTATADIISGTEGLDSSSPLDTTTASAAGDTGTVTSTDNGEDTDTSNSADTPRGYVWTGYWHGCAWTQTDTPGKGTTIVPVDFTQKADTENFCISGTVGADTAAFAAIGFNLNDPVDTANCAIDAAQPATSNEGVVPKENGITLNFQTPAPQLNVTVELIGSTASTSPPSRWCSSLILDGVDERETRFVLYESFAECGENASGNPYAGEPIVAVKFRIDGVPEQTMPYDLCILGFIDGNVPDDPWDTPDIGPGKGTIGGDGGYDYDYDRALVMVEGERYIIQNNFYAHGTGYQTLICSGNSFEIIKHTSSANTNSEGPLAFPSIYIGQQGNRAITTTQTDNLPTRITNISSANARFRWSGNPVYSSVNMDLWFSNDNPPMGGQEYGDAVSGIVKLWLNSPAGYPPIGNSTGETVTFCGHSWTVWAGPRGTNADYPQLPGNRPVITFVSATTLNELKCDLVEVIQTATSASYGGVAIPSQWYLTDIIAGFEIWSAPAVGLWVDEFAVVVEN